ncbi:hypothetical protein EJ02DRAFT_435122 [Clathrospora elynae]|uniref:F-box domain-containing protein n=1 Tax=Clathrospora elynae TaxID=706981 RepID=A0A6A5SN55_9PLEO|nr:hypothetical protein EJ02DRAFT_435122 [Clathrospora elynae]
MMFPFLRLPAELRNQIYEYAALNGDQPFVLRKVRDRPHGDGSKQRANLLAINKQVRAEYFSIYFSIATVAIYWSDLLEFQQDFCVSSNANASVLPNKMSIYMEPARAVPGPPLDILPLLTMRARQHGPSIIKAAMNAMNATNADNNLTALRCFIDYLSMRNILEFDKSVWLSLLRRRAFIGVYLRAEAWFCISSTQVRLRGVKSELSAKEMAQVTECFRGWGFDPTVTIMDWIPRAGRKGRETLELVHF